MGFIIVVDNDVYYDRHEVFTSRSTLHRVYLCTDDDDRPELISPRVAKYYTNRSISEYKGKMYLCPESAPYLRNSNSRLSRLSRSSGSSRSGSRHVDAHLCCSNKYPKQEGVTNNGFYNESYGW